VGAGNGELGPDAYRFVDFIVEGGFTVWQTLPLGPTHEDLSPYSCQSAQAGNEALISLELLEDRGWLEADRGPVEGESPRRYRARRLGEAYQRFVQGPAPGESQGVREFAAEHGHWLEDYALFRVLKLLYKGLPWQRWPAELRDRHPEALKRVRRENGAHLDQVRFEQYLFFSQWRELRRYANERGVLMFGDMPLFVATDSADVWAHRECFRLGDDGQPEVVAGVPPDYFSATGQRWGNPHYDWAHLEATGFEWWMQRFGSQLELFDLLRIDHFRGLEACWEIPADEPTAINGHWVEAPGDALLAALRARFDRLPLVAEDLGVITPEVEALRDRFGLPGMRILQFAFDGGPGNPYLPHNYARNAVVYTGTHDNDTTMGWYGGLDEATRQRVLDYLGCTPDAMPAALCRAAFSSVAQLAIVPLQDILRLGTEQRMNTPGTHNDSNWRWRFSWDQVNTGVATQYRRGLELYGRV
jgi:4-alpha-glucanotransferase